MPAATSASRTAFTRRATSVPASRARSAVAVAPTTRCADVAGTVIVDCALVWTFGVSWACASEGATTINRAARQCFIA
jgi:hypothetical protein